MAKVFGFETSKEIDKILHDNFSSYNDPFFDSLRNVTPEGKYNFYKAHITSAFEKFMSDANLVSCVISFLKLDLNVSKTSKICFLHHNTVLYRLDKVKRLTGLDIKKFEDAYRMRVMLEIFYACRNV